MEITENLSKQPLSTGSDRMALKNCLRDYFHLLESPHFRLQVLRCDGSYLRVFTVLFNYSWTNFFKTLLKISFTQEQSENT